MKNKLTGIEKLTLILFHERIFYLCDPVRWNTTHCDICPIYDKKKGFLCLKILKSINLNMVSLVESSQFNLFKNKILKIVEEIADE